MSRRTAAHLTSLALAVLTTLGMLGGIDRMAGAEHRLGEAMLTAQAAHATRAA